VKHISKIIASVHVTVIGDWFDMWNTSPS